VSALTIYSDGGCSGNPGPGAWAYILISGEERYRAVESVPSTTNNRMELQGVIAALQEVGRHPEWRDRELEIFTDSEYVKKGITEWIENWERNGWRTRSREAVKNKELWQDLRRLSRSRSIRWRWLQGHSGNPWNEECDRLVRQAIGRLKR
jgi:ribonuclease HI